MLLVNICIINIWIYFTLKRIEGGDLKVEEVIYFVFEIFERIDVLLFHELAILF